jgi:acyl carrier protein
MPGHDEALKIIAELAARRASGPRHRDVRPTDRIQEDLGLDSLAVMELASDVENRFGVSIPSEMFNDIKTVEDVARAVLALQANPDAKRGG